MFKELDLCQEHLSTSYVRSWQSGGIILVGALASLALMLQIQATSLAAAVATTGFAFGAVFVLILWLLFLQRETAFQRVSIRRSRVLEAKLGMRRQALIRALDELASEKPGSAFNAASDEEREMLDNIYARSYRLRVPFLAPGGTNDTLFRLGYAVIAGWIAVVIWSWLIHFRVLE